MGILHVVDSADPMHCVGTLIEHVMDGTPSCGHDLIVLGTRDSLDQWSPVLTERASVIPRRSMSQMARDLQSMVNSSGPCQIVAWSLAAATVATAIVPTASISIIVLKAEAGATGLSLLAPPGCVDLRRCATISSDVAALVHHQTASKITLVQPPVGTDPEPAERRLIREAWGIGDDVLAIGVINDVPPWCSIHAARETVIRLDAVGVASCLVFDARSADAHAESVPLVRAGLRRLLRPIHGFWSLDALSALDIAIVGDGDHPLQRAGPRWARARAGMIGVPVVAPSGTDGPDAAANFTPGDLDSLSRAVLSLLDDGADRSQRVVTPPEPGPSLAAWVYREVLDGV